MRRPCTYGSVARQAPHDLGQEPGDIRCKVEKAAPPDPGHGSGASAMVCLRPGKSTRATTEEYVMSGGFEWSGYASQSLPGISEALDAAGIDCVIHQHQPDEDASDIFLQRIDP